jgi:thioredoxin
MNAIDALTQDTFADALQREGITAIDFWAGWCGPCRTMAPQFERAAEMRPQYRCAKVDVDSEPSLAGEFGIRSIPTLVVLRDGKPVAAQSGVIGAQQLLDALDRIAAKTPADPAPAATEVK